MRNGRIQHPQSDLRIVQTRTRHERTRSKLKSYNAILCPPKHNGGHFEKMLCSKSFRSPKVATFSLVSSSCSFHRDPPRIASCTLRACKRLDARGHRDVVPSLILATTITNASGKHSCRKSSTRPSCPSHHAIHRLSSQLQRTPKRPRGGLKEQAEGSQRHRQALASTNEKPYQPSWKPRLSVDFSPPFNRRKMKKTCLRGAEPVVTLKGGLTMDLEQPLGQFLLSRVRRKTEVPAPLQQGSELVVD
jgi:hypothetical protein